MSLHKEIMDIVLSSPSLIFKEHYHGSTKPDFTQRCTGRALKIAKENDLTVMQDVVWEHEGWIHLVEVDVQGCTEELKMKLLDCD